MTHTLLDWAQLAAKTATSAGAKDTRVKARRSREVVVEWRDGKLDRIRESTKQSLSLALYVDGRFSGNSTSDLRESAVTDFVKATVAATRLIAPDEHRHLPDPSRYASMAPKLDILDAALFELTPDVRLNRVRALEDASRAGPDADKILSVTTWFSDTTTKLAMVTTNGLVAEEEDSNASLGAEVSVRGEGDRKPESYAYADCRFLADLPSVEEVGKEALRRALGQIGTKPVATGKYDMVLENRAVPTFWRHMMQPLAGQAVQQKRSFLDGKLNTAVTAGILTITDDPHIQRGLGSTAWDGEGMATRALPLIERGTLKTFYLDTYYGSKLGVTPTTGGMSNLKWELGKRDAAGMVQSLKNGIFVTEFLGGNSNATTGDFSVGIRGFLVRNGRIEHPVSEMNMAGNHLELWKKLCELGNDPWRYSSNRAPSLLFKDVQFSGTGK